VKTLDDITGTIIDCSLKIHRDLGLGCWSRCTRTCSCICFTKRGFRVERRKAIRFEYEGRVFRARLKADLIVEDQVIVELKSTEKVPLVHKKQLLTYLRLTNKRLGLLINFGGATLKQGLFRMVNRLPPSASPRLRVNQLMPDVR